MIFPMIDYAMLIVIYSTTKNRKFIDNFIVNA